jgi:hypothetical protein
MKAIQGGFRHRRGATTALRCRELPGQNRTPAAIRQAFCAEKFW